MFCSVVYHNEGSASLRSEEIFFAALELEGDERSRFLLSRCHGDSELRKEVNDLLSAHAVAGSFFLEPIKASRAEAVLQSAQIDSSNDRVLVDGYKIVERMGEGGCGTVYIAEQEKPVRRPVALKVIKLGMDTKEIIARFAAERQVLAMMEHPNIAKFFDAGTTQSGCPYFVMELIHGVPITKFCDERNLSTAARLGLFLQVCRAVQHAHQKGIIHRDLKPSNILVALHDDIPVPKIIDFGIAKATGDQITGQTVLTALGQFIGTPAYMSPEQAQLSAMDVDTRSDIYSLGVLLYELLTGRTPFDSAELLKVGIDEMRRHICEVDPPRPSTRLITMQGDALGTAAQRRQIAPLKLIKLVRGDLDWIVMRCLEKDRTRRYETASGLANDIVRHLEDEPVSASPPSALYRFQKLVRRNRLVFASVAAAACALFIGIIVSTRQAVRAGRAERVIRSEADRANSATAIAKAVNDFLVSDLLRQAAGRTQPDSNAAPESGLKVREALDRAGEKVGARFEEQPLVEAAVRDAIGTAYLGLGDSTKANLHHRRALKLRADTLGAAHPSTLMSTSNFAAVYFSQGKFAEAAALHAQTLEIRKQVLGAEHPHTLDSMSSVALGYHAQGKIDETVKLQSQTLEIQKRVLGTDRSETLSSMSNLALTYGAHGKLSEAAALHVQALEIRKRVLGVGHPDTLASMKNVANAYAAQGKFPQAAELHMQTLEISKRVLGVEHPDTLTSMDNLASARASLGKLAAAVALHAETLEARKRVLGVEHPSTLNSMSNLAGVYAAQGNFAAAGMLGAQTLEIRKQVLGSEHPDTLKSMSSLVSALISQGRLVEAAALHAQAFEIQQRVLGSEHPDMLASIDNLANVYYAQERFAEAAALYSQTLKIRRRVRGAEHPDTLSSANHLASAYRAQGKFPEAVTLHVQTLTIQQRVLGPEHPDTLTSINNLALAHSFQGKFAEAAELHTRTLETRKQVLGVDHPETLNSMENLARAHEQMNDYPKAETLYREILASRMRKEEGDSTTKAALGRNLLHQQRFAEAEPMLREALATGEKILPDQWPTFHFQSLLGGALAGQMKFIEAESFLISGYGGMKLRESKILPLNKVSLKEALERIVQVYSDWGQSEKAIAWKLELDAIDATEPSARPNTFRR